MKFVIFGANGPTGRLAVEQALAEGHDVAAVTRHPDSFPVRSPGLRVVTADVLDAASVDRAVDGGDTVISAVGVPYTKERVTVFSDGAANIVKAMCAHGVRRLVCVSSIGVTGEPAPGETIFFRKVIGPVLLKMGRSLYQDGARMEEVVRSSGLDWTIVRAAGLFDGAGVTRYQAGPPPLPGRFTSRRDLADLLVREAAASQHVGAVLDVITTEGTPSYASVFAKEALRLTGSRA